MFGALERFLRRVNEELGGTKPGLETTAEEIVKKSSDNKTPVDGD